MPATLESATGCQLRAALQLINSLAVKQRLFVSHRQVGAPSRGRTGTTEVEEF